MEENDDWKVFVPEAKDLLKGHISGFLPPIIQMCLASRFSTRFKMHTNRTPMTMGNRERAQREEKLYEKADFDEKDPRGEGGTGI